MSLLFSAFSALPATATLSIPVDPDAPDARRLLIDELSKPAYREAQPTWFDRISETFFNWLGSLFSGAGGAGGGWLPLIATIAIAAIIVVALLLWGVPRLNRRKRSGTLLFGEHDERSADQMRLAARAAAEQSNWPLAIAEQFRALAAGLSERTIVEVNPGTTATDFARSAARTLPDEQMAFSHAARAFDEVRYLEHSGSESDYLAVFALDERVRKSKLTFPEPSDLLTSSDSRAGGLS